MNNECCEHKMTRKLFSDLRYVHNQERTSLLPLKHLQILFFFTFLVNFQCKWMLWSVDSRTIIGVQAWTACGHCEKCLVFLNFDVIVPLIKSFYLIQRHWIKSKYEIFAKSRNLSVAKYAHIYISRKFHVMR